MGSLDLGKEAIDLEPGQGLALFVDHLNAEQGARISVFRLDIADAQERPLLKYVRDIQLSRGNWWQAGRHPGLVPTSRTPQRQRPSKQVRRASP